MATCTGYCAREVSIDTEDPFGGLLEALGKALALADLVDVGLVAIHILDAIHAAERHGFSKAQQGLASDVVAAVTTQTSGKFH